VQRLSKETREMIGDLGLRNSHLLSIQPTGNTSTLGNAPSSGIEPVFMHSYIRTSEQPALPEGLHPPALSPDAYEVGEEIDADGTTWVAEEHGDETVLRCQEEGHTHWQLHPTRGICKDQTVKDYAVRHMERDGTWDPDADWAVTTRDLDVDDHLAQMKALAPFVDSSMSKTVNVPNDYPFDEFKELYQKAHDTGVIKGVTTYRAGTMSAVLSGGDEEDQTVPRTDAPERPETLPCAVHRVRYRGDHWTILVGFLEDDPYEVFAFKSDGETPLFQDQETRLDEGHIRKNQSQHYSLLGTDEAPVIEDITSHMPRADAARVDGPAPRCPDRLPRRTAGEGGRLGGLLRAVHGQSAPRPRHYSPGDVRQVRLRQRAPRGRMHGMCRLRPLALQLIPKAFGTKSVPGPDLHGRALFVVERLFGGWRIRRDTGGGAAKGGPKRVPVCGQPSVTAPFSLPQAPRARPILGPPGTLSLRRGEQHKFSEAFPMFRSAPAHDAFQTVPTPRSTLRAPLCACVPAPSASSPLCTARRGSPEQGEPALDGRDGIVWRIASVGNTKMRSSGNYFRSLEY